MLKPNRSPIACEFCRKSKIKCPNPGDGSICARCKKLGRDQCFYKPKGHQAMKFSSDLQEKERDLSVPKLTLESTYDKPLKNDRENSISTVAESLNYSSYSPLSTRQTTEHSPTSHPSVFPIPVPCDLPQQDAEPRTPQYNQYYDDPHIKAVVFPPTFMVVNTIKIFFSIQYNGIFQFLHKETFLRHYESLPAITVEQICTWDLEENPEFDPVLLLSILAIAARFDPMLIQFYGDFNEELSPELYNPNFSLTTAVSPVQSDNMSRKTGDNASNYFGYHARKLLGEFFDRPSLPRIQALTILASHEWGNVNASRSYLYNGIAARMSIIVGLSQPTGAPYIKIHDSTKLTPVERNIKLESLRRTMWSVYMMDRANSSGRNRSFAIRIEDIGISLPCQDLEFAQGLTVNYAGYSQSLEMLSLIGKTELSGSTKVSMVGSQILFFELWSRIAKWCGEGGALKENKSIHDKDCTFTKLLSELRLLEASLPLEFQFNVENLTYYVSINNVENYGYIHCLIFQCKVVLYREIFYLRNCTNLLISVEEWWKLTKFLLDFVKASSNLIKTLRAINLIVDAPILSFQIFTNLIISLYFISLPNKYLLQVTDKITILKLKKEHKSIADLNIRMLHENIWKLGKKYYSLVKELSQVKLVNYLTNDELKNRVHDYGEGQVQEDSFQSVPISRSTSIVSESSTTASVSLSQLNVGRSMSNSNMNSDIDIKHNSQHITGSNLAMDQLIEEFRATDDWKVLDVDFTLPNKDTTVKVPALN